MTLTIVENSDELAARAADLIVRVIRDAIAARGRAMLALSGGTTPLSTYALLAQPERRSEIEWDRVTLFLTDERFVPPNDPASNFGALQRTLLTPAALKAERAFAVPTQLATADAAASAYEATLARVFGIDGEHLPRFDLILLGLGEDGHTAALFPRAAALLIETRWAVASPPGSLPPRVERITMTFPVLNAAREVVFLVSGSRKAAALRDVLTDRPLDEPLPAARVRPVDGNLTWLVDRAAARML